MEVSKWEKMIGRRIPLRIDPPPRRMKRKGKRNG
jgi:hypothetical protein